MVKLGDAWTFQQRKVAALKKQSFAKLSNLPDSTALDVPPKLKGLAIFVRRRRGQNGGVEITVCVEEGPMSSVQGFEILPNGKILPL